MATREPMIKADEATVLLLDKMLQELRRVSDQSNQTLQLVKQQIPEGIIDPKEVTATTIPFSIIPPLDKKWFSISIINDGPDDCYVVVNTEKSSTNPHLILIHEAFEVDLNIAKIIDAQVWCSSGTSALRIRGMR